MINGDTMPEFRTITDLNVQYEGLFKMSEVYDLIEQWTKEKGYDKNELKNHEQVLKDGRDIFIDSRPTKAFSDYDRIIIKMIIHVKNMKDVIVKKDGLDVPMNQGKLNIHFTGYLVTDWGGRWESKPWYFFLRTVFDRWVYGSNTSVFEGAVSQEVNHLYRNVKGYLNMNRY